MSTTSSVTNWAGWLERWEAQQDHLMPDRQERFGVIIDAVAGLGGETQHIVDLGCGPGSLSRLLLDRLPGARVTAIDVDPVLLAIGRHALDSYDGRLRFVDADLRGAWDAEVDGPADAAVSTTALHWLQADTLPGLYARVAEVLRPGGLFLNGDSLAFPGDEPHITTMARAMRDRRNERRTASPGEGWDEWWAAVVEEPGLAAEVAERALRHHDHPDHDHAADLAFHRDALRWSGFAETDTLWQHLTDRVLVAVR